ncbi:flagellar export chaperone FliS [Pseudomarimonas arenosa]|uniref:Flagellar secretion chaperone FliS n=1 Tax=Pseudomarimonas arenosa TaxID=2774145 RepID=A0AAW3ZGQ6_9GAMM|nr:flagellar export chaperone FliS [Pseudomarimonas arenosa]MBD8524749.1 flagellar export chaperone FliS [Pseudomarimonas arenosa]
MYPSRGNADAYKSAAIHSGVELPPQRKLALLLSGAIDRIRLAETQIQNGQISEKLTTINTVLTILEALRASLDHDGGGEIADRLSSIYTTAEARLVSANAQNDLEGLRAVVRLLTPIEQAFRQLATPSASEPPTEPPSTPTSRHA